MGKAYVRFKATGEVRPYSHYDPTFEGEGGYGVLATQEEIERGLPPVEWYSHSIVELVENEPLETEDTPHNPNDPNCYCAECIGF